MANTSKFNREKVLRKASDLFWAKGFAGTSIRDIQDTVDMRPGSIYATFGSKEGLYKEALSSYAQMMSDQLDQHLAQASNIQQGLIHFIEYVIIDSCNEAPSGVCMLFRASGEFFGQNPALFEFSQDLLKHYEAKITAIFADAKHRKEAPPTLDEKAAGQQFVIQFTGLRNYFNGRNEPALAKLLITNMVTSIMHTP